LPLDAIARLISSASDISIQKKDLGYIITDKGIAVQKQKCTIKETSKLRFDEAISKDAIPGRGTTSDQLVDLIQKRIATMPHRGN